MLKEYYFGDSSNIENDIKQNFKDCNLSHVLAVSGSHLVYLVLGVEIALKRIAGKRNTRIITIIIILIFMVITNMSAPVVRAGISAIVAILAKLLYRKQDTFTTIAFSLLLIEIDNPFSLFDIGLQLSYLGTLGIVIFCEDLEGKLPKFQNKIIKYIVENVLITISANILIIPITAYSFNIISLNFIISNLLTGPIVGACTILGFFTLIVSLIFMPIAKIMGVALNFLFKMLIIITETIAKIPGGNITICTPHIVLILWIYISIFLLKVRKISVKKVIAILLIIVLITNYKPNGNLVIHFVDVGQGDCTLICTPNGQNILIDGGGSNTPEKYNIGEQVLVPYLLDRKIKKLDYVVISHFDSDHVRRCTYSNGKIKSKNGGNIKTKRR